MNALASDLALPPGAGWYCLRVLTHREHVAARNLQQRTGVEVFSPRIRVRRASRRGAVAMVTEALFPGYVFARFRYPYEARRVASTPGVVGLVSFGGPPPAVADGVIARLATEVRRAAEAPPAAQFAAGVWVRIVTGCFRGSEGRVVGAGGASTRVCVLLDLLGHQIQVSVPGDQLAGADAGTERFPAGLRTDTAAPPPPR